MVSCTMIYLNDLKSRMDMILETKEW